MLVGCSIDARWVFDWCSLAVRLTFVGCSIGVRWMSDWCSVGVRLTSVGRSIDARCMFDWCSLDVRLIFVGCSIDARWLLDWSSLDNRMRFAIDARRMFDWFSLDVRLTFFGCSIDVRWMFDWCSLDVRWVFDCDNFLLGHGRHFTVAHSRHIRRHACSARYTRRAEGEPHTFMMLATEPTLSRLLAQDVPWAKQSHILYNLPSRHGNAPGLISLLTLLGWNSLIYFYPSSGIYLVALVASPHCLVQFMPLHWTILPRPLLHLLCTCLITYFMEKHDFGSLGMGGTNSRNRE